MLDTPSKDDPPKDPQPALPKRLLELLGYPEKAEAQKGPGRNRPRKEPEERKQHFAAWYIFAAFLGVMFVQYLWLRYSQVETIPYSQFEQLLDDNKITSVLVGSDTIQGTLKEPLSEGRKLFYTVRVDPALADRLKAHGVTVTGAPTNTFLSTILSWVLPIFIFYLIWMYGFRRMAER